MGRPLLVGFHGVKRSGKDTAASFLEEWARGRSLSFKRRGFADIAKWAWVRQFLPDISMENAVKWMDNFKDEGYRVVIEQPEAPSKHLVDVDFRQCMAQFSTESARLIYGEDHWVDQLLPVDMYIDAGDMPLYPKWHDSFAASIKPSKPRTFAANDKVVADICAIIDIRFDNEVQRIRSLGGTLVKIRRITAERAVLEEAEATGLGIHESELGIPDQEFDFVVSNNHEFEDLKRQVFSLATMLTTEGVRDAR